MISAAIFPIGKLDDQTIDQVVATAIASGLVACNATTGPFRIGFFKRGRIPKGWAQFGMVTKESPCVAQSLSSPGAFERFAICAG